MEAVGTVLMATGAIMFILLMLGLFAALVWAAWDTKDATFLIPAVLLLAFVLTITGSAMVSSQPQRVVVDTQQAEKP